MCRSIKTLRRADPVTDEEVRAAARQFVRKVSGFREPSSKNAKAFEAAVADVTRATERLLGALPPSKATSKGSTPSSEVRRLTTR